ncbi:MAG: 5-amino-6-(D-ribitylamino)uracil--L-tyrosine 4-hydroxyphenyl transferase CofH [Candidatus Bathyarchaeia archaeon]
MAAILDRALDEKEISPKEGIELMKTSGRDLWSLILTADWLRRKRVGDIVTYIVNRNINLTNICTVGCKFCAFHRLPGAPDAYTLSIGKVAEMAREAWERGATEVCIQGGCNPTLDAHYYVELISAVKAAAPGIHIHGFSPMEIYHVAQRANLPIREVLKMLKEVGLGSIPGTAAEIFSERVRRTLCPNKLPTHLWVEIIKTAHKLGIPSTSTMMYGHIDESEDCVEHLQLLRAIQKETHGFTEFIPLSFIHQRAPIFLEGNARPGATGIKDLKIYAVSRIFLNGWVDNIQVSWVKLGLKFAQVALNAGANDFGGTLMEENISRAAGATAGEYLSPVEIRRLIRDIGRIPAERNTTYKILRMFGGTEL